MRQGARTTGKGAHPGAKMSWPAPSGLMVRSGNRHRPGWTGIRLPKSAHQVREQNRGKYSDNDKHALTGLADYLKSQGVTELDVCGLATDYCVKFSALD